jgi:hypothetical protein
MGSTAKVGCQLLWYKRYADCCSELFDVAAPSVQAAAIRHLAL